METLNMTASRDQKQFYKLLDNLINTNKEFLQERKMKIYRYRMRLRNLMGQEIWKKM